ncbi:hypothetical protein CEE44_04670 [Candidatus Woesearchaeota archaeon B3_Woes]|nr:MAG: hypothetical protein CEE44_04670 [Candidatus Woesearchaeota archaeon B3_Woes]
MKIQLIHPPIDEEYKGHAIKDWLMGPPTGLELIAKATELFVEETNIEVIDGNRHSLDTILKTISADFVGMSSQYSNYHNALNILRQAKLKGATTVIGGPNINHIAKRTLRNNPFIDYAVVGDGEDSFSMLVKGIPFSDIPNLVYRENNNIKENQKISIRLGMLFDLEHLDWKVYDKNDQVPISSIRGCIKAQTDGRCTFCSIDSLLRVMAPEKVWQQIDILNRKYGFNYFFETGDSFVVGNFPQKLLESRPNHLSEIKFRIYTSPDQITPEIVEVFRELNVKNLLLGIESANDTILEKSGKAYSRQDIDNALNLLYGADMDLILPFIYGLPGESEKTLENNYQYAKEVVKRHPGMFVLASKAIPMVGSELFTNLMNNTTIKSQYQGDLLRDDILDYQQLIKLQTKHFTSVTYEKVSEYTEKTRNLVGETRTPSFGEWK